MVSLQEVKVDTTQSSTPSADITSCLDVTKNNNPLLSRSLIIFNQNSIFKITWEIALVPLFIYILTLHPLWLATLHSQLTPRLLSSFGEIYIHIVLALDILVSLLTLQSNAKEKISFFKNAVIYFQNCFILDCLAAIPFHLIFPSCSPNVRVLLGCLLFLKFARIKYFSAKLYQTAIGTLSLFGNPRFIVFPFCVLFVTHFVSCGWIFLGLKRDRNEITWITKAEDDRHITMHDTRSLPNLYVTSLYWTFCTLSTTGFGDIVPVTTEERLYTMCCVSLGVFFYSLMFSYLTYITLHTFRVKSKYVIKLEKLERFLKSSKLPIALAMRARLSLQHNQHSNCHPFQEDILNELPSQLRDEIEVFLFRTVVDKIPFLQGKPIRLISRFLRMSENKILDKNDVMGKEGEPCEEMVFILQGSLECFKESDGTVVEIIKEGNFYGELAYFGGIHPFTIRALEEVSIRKISKELLPDIFQGYPETINQMKDIGRQRFLKVGKEEMMSSILGFSQETLSPDGLNNELCQSLAKLTFEFQSLQRSLDNKDMFQ